MPPGGAYVAALQGLGPIERVCVQMPDPWFKKRHRPRRVMTPPSGGGGFRWDSKQTRVHSYASAGGRFASLNDGH